MCFEQKEPSGSRTNSNRASRDHVLNCDPSMDFHTASGLATRAVEQPGQVSKRNKYHKLHATLWPGPRGCECKCYERCCWARWASVLPWVVSAYVLSVAACTHVCKMAWAHWVVSGDTMSMLLASRAAAWLGRARLSAQVLRAFLLAPGAGTRPGRSGS